MNSYAKFFLVHTKVTHREQAKYHKYLQQIHCQLNRHFFLTLSFLKYEIIKSSQDVIYLFIYFKSRLLRGQSKLCCRKNHCFKLQVGKIITVCEEWQVSRACFDTTLLKETPHSCSHFHRLIHICGAHEQTYTFHIAAEVFKGAAF